MNLSARLPSWGYLLRRGASEHASHGGYIARAMQRGKQWRRRPWQKGRHGPSMLHLANTDGCQGLASQACPLQVAPRPSEPTLKGPTRCLRGLSSNDMPHSPLKLGRWAPPPRQWEESWYCCRRIMVEREKCSKWLCLCWGSVWGPCGLNHIIIRKQSGAASPTKIAIFGLLVKYVSTVVFRLEFKWLYFFVVLLKS